MSISILDIERLAARTDAIRDQWMKVQVDAYHGFPADMSDYEMLAYSNLRSEAAMVPADKKADWLSRYYAEAARLWKLRSQ